MIFVGEKENLGQIDQLARFINLKNLTILVEEKNLHAQTIDKN